MNAKLGFNAGLVLAGLLAAATASAQKEQWLQYAQASGYGSAYQYVEREGPTTNRIELSPLCLSQPTAS